MSEDQNLKLILSMLGAIADPSKTDVLASAREIAAALPDLELDVEQIAQYLADVKLAVKTHEDSEEIILIECSERMQDQAQEILDTFNNYIEERKSCSGKTILTLALFNEQCVLLHDRADIQQVQPLSMEFYRPAGCSALYDAVGHVLSGAKEQILTEGHDLPVRVTILSEQADNASLIWTHSLMNELLEELQKLGWIIMVVGDGVYPDEQPQQELELHRAVVKKAVLN